MVYKRFRLNCIIRVSVIGATIYLFFYLLSHTTLYATTFIVAILSAFQIFSLIHYVEKTNRDFTRLLRSIKYSDFSQSFTSTIRGTSFEELNAALNEVVQEFRRARAEKEEHFRYLQTVVQHVGIGLIAFKQNGEVDLINNAAKRILKIPHLKHIDKLESVSSELVEKLIQLKHGDKALVKFQENDELLQLAIYATNFTLRQQNYKLVSIQNIQSELEEKEMEAWQNLIRVLTHEIMNSVTPISSLASTANSLLTSQYNSGNDIIETSGETIRDVCNAVQTIEKRSHGLLGFVDNYRKLTRIPKPNYQILSLADMLRQILNLMKTQLEEKRIDIQVDVDPESLELTADPDLIEQVIINLIKNSIEAVDGTSAPVIKLTATMDGRGRVIIQVSDNGQGIQKDVLEKIFIPFFTTKGEGSGIGLSLSRQIMRLHGGTISVKSQPDFETVFTLRF